VTIRFQRLIIIIISLVLFAGATLLILYNSKNNLIFYYTPSELYNVNLKSGDKVRIGGFVKKNSIKKNLNQNIEFIVKDSEREILISYNGILPDLFNEEQGVVVEGILIKKNKLNAETVFAKHDENYMPASIKKQLEEKEQWKKNY
tara:strand:+ start:42 stop:479 length:438 start_codon:yes stop_codon:yes gene_type:complete